MDYTGTLIVEVVALALAMVLLCRWVFGQKGTRRGTQRPDYGLLVPVLRTDHRPAADQARERLAAAGLRATVASAGIGYTHDGRPWPADACVLLVFPPDVDAANQLLRPAATR